MFPSPNNLGWFCKGRDISDLMAKAIRGHMSCHSPDAVLNIETHLFNTVLYAETCDFDLDIGKHVWLNVGRWSRLCKEYVPLEALNRFIDQCTEILEGKARLGATANMQFRDPERYAKKHRWGGCLMGATFRGDGAKSGRSCLTFYTRTTYIGYMGLLDAAIAYCIARYICDRTSKPVIDKLSLDSISFRWHISSQQVHCFKTLPYIYSQPDLMQRLERLGRNKRLLDRPGIPPTWKHLGKWYCKVVDGYEKRGNLSVEDWLLTEKYGPFRRIKRRWCEAKGFLSKHVPPSLPVSKLTFEKCI